MSTEGNKKGEPYAMLIQIKSSATTINLSRYDYVRAVGKTVEAGSGLCQVKIAECETESMAKRLENAISKAWAWPQAFFDVDEWLNNQPAASK